MKAKSTWPLALILVLNCVCSGKEQQTPDRVLSSAELEVYNETYEQCKTGTIESALRVGHRPEVIIGAAANVLQVLSLQYNAIQSRVESQFYSPELYRLRANYGYWLAIVECYEHHSLAKKLFIKGLIDMGHLNSEVTGTFLSLSSALQLAVGNAILMKQYPLFHRLFAIIGIDLRFYNMLKSIKHEFLAEPGSEENKQIQAIENHLFDETNESLKLTLNFLLQQQENVLKELEDPGLSREKREELNKKKDRLQHQISYLRQSIE